MMIETLSVPGEFCRENPAAYSLAWYSCGAGCLYAPEQVSIELFVALGPLFSDALSHV